jgi:hypothetical protein
MDLSGIPRWRGRAGCKDKRADQTWATKRGDAGQVGQRSCPIPDIALTSHASPKCLQALDREFVIIADRGSACVYPDAHT